VHCDIRGPHGLTQTNAAVARNWPAAWSRTLSWRWRWESVSPLSSACSRSIS
jgi:hypothetical protein